ncbi:MAG: hypothetical protein JNL93_17980 [Pelomonas sp.]|nr:hypothetical protein [Roseateles sp.]
MRAIERAGERDQGEGGVMRAQHSASHGRQGSGHGLERPAQVARAQLGSKHHRVEVRAQGSKLGISQFVACTFQKRVQSCRARIGAQGGLDDVDHAVAALEGSDDVVQLRCPNFDGVIEAIGAEQTHDFGFQDEELSCRVSQLQRQCLQVLGAHQARAFVWPRVAGGRDGDIEKLTNVIRACRFGRLDVVLGGVAFQQGRIGHEQVPRGGPQATADVARPLGLAQLGKCRSLRQPAIAHG